MNEARTLAQQLAAFALDVRAARPPEDVAASARQRILDILGIAVAATELDTSSSVLDFVRDQGGHSRAGCIGIADKVPASWAAFGNGVLAHSLDYDDTHLPSVLHPSASVVPAGLAVGETVAASGRSVVDAIAVGIEVTIRLGMAGYDESAGNSIYFEHGQHATSICGTIGSAVTAAMLHGLDIDGITDAMGIAASMAAGVIEGNRTGGTVKRIHCGWAAHGGVVAADLARAGITGPPTVLEGRFGFFQGFLHGQFDPAPVVDGLGSEWAVPGIFFKPYPANHFTHTAADAAMELRRRGVEPSAIESLTVGVATPTVRTIGQPIDKKRRPETGYQGQFSGPYVVASALMGGGGLGLALDDFADELVADPERIALMDKISIEGDGRCDAIYPHQFPAVLTARLVDGSEIVVEVLENRGGPQNPLTDDELALKFTSNAARRMSPESTERVRIMCESLESAQMVDDIVATINEGMARRTA